MSKDQEILQRFSLNCVTAPQFRPQMMLQEAD